MIKVDKDFDNIPFILNSTNRKEAFDKNIEDKAFNHGKTLYKPEELKNRLYTIYNKKCVYCEDTLLNAPKHIEHYRPKNIYYWLSYSWDNLLLCCGSCNSSKGVNFDTINEKVKYNNEPYSDIHHLGNKYDTLEQPMLINPEKENVIDEIVFSRDAEISSQNDRVKYTIETCNLNREELLELRIEILNDFIQLVNGYHLLLDAENSKDKKMLVQSFIPLVQKFINDCSNENKFYSFRYFILNNIDLFFDEKVSNILKYLIVKLSK